MTSKTNQNLPIQATEEQAVAETKKVKISKTALIFLSFVALLIVVVPPAVLGKLYKDEKDKNDELSSSSAGDESGTKHAMTTWWVIFNNPENCIQSPADDVKCGPLDVFGSAFLESQQAGAPDLNTIVVNTDAGVAMLYATGGVTDENGDLRMQASIFKSTDILSLPYSMDPMALGLTLTNPAAEVHFILRDHGVSVGDISQTLADIDDYCDDPPFLWFGSKQEATGNICSDFQAVAFAEGEAGIKKLSFVASGKESTESEAHLYRHGDGLQAVIFTNVFE